MNARKIDSPFQKASPHASPSAIGRNYDIFDLPFLAEHSSNKKPLNRGILLEHGSHAIGTADRDFVLVLRPMGRARRAALKRRHNGNIGEGSGADEQDSNSSDAGYVGFAIGAV